MAGPVVLAQKQRIPVLVAKYFVFLVLVFFWFCCSCCVVVSVVVVVVVVVVVAALVARVASPVGLLRKRGLSRNQFFVLKKGCISKFGKRNLP